MRKRTLRSSISGAEIRMGLEAVVSARDSVTVSFIERTTSAPSSTVWPIAMSLNERLEDVERVTKLLILAVSCMAESGLPIRYMTSESDASFTSRRPRSSGRKATSRFIFAALTMVSPEASRTVAPSTTRVRGKRRRR